MKVVFLDYDGVVNTPLWMEHNGKISRRFGQSFDGKVNNYQAVCWVSSFCEKHGYSIVVSSTWRFDDDYDVMLLRGGLWKGIRVIGRTPNLIDHIRGDEIGQYLADHPDITGYLIFDDDNDMGEHIDHLVRCDPVKGFDEEAFYRAEMKHNEFGYGGPEDE